ncbi:MAG: addiction module protein [Leptospirales bacterium]|jgi:putative addiction module component (TIGR02574 family)
MSQLENLTLSEIKALEPEDRLSAIDEIWASIATDQPNLGVKEHEKALLDDAARDLRDNPASGASWEEFRPRLDELL